MISPIDNLNGSIDHCLIKFIQSNTAAKHHMILKNIHLISIQRKKTCNPINKMTGQDKLINSRTSLYVFKVNQDPKLIHVGSQT